MSENEQQIPTVYDPKTVEQKWYQLWAEQGYFNSETTTAKRRSANQPTHTETYSIVIPPPNVTGVLHMGHALDFTLQDVLIRRKRMQGYNTLWLPGMDHAGIATQARVEATLRQQGVSRYDLGREKFVDKVWEWKEEYASVIRSQWSRMGFSVDYSRERFTMDEGLSEAVRTVFVKLYEKGLIYRGKRIINWDPAARTALSDIEVEHKEVQGAFYHMRYPFTDGSGHITIATTRPETMLGDTAVAVHPADERYQHAIGKTVLLPIVNREIPIVADEYVDREFGSGAVKITPAHDPNDFELAQRHDLPPVIVMDESGTMNENAGPYQGQDRFDCRKQIVADLQEQGVLFKIEEHMHSVGHSERTGVVVEPMLSTQWFVKMAPLAEAAIELQKGPDAVRFVPDRFEKIYLHWIENIRDWCISRQLWWGHRVPAWYCDTCGETIVAMEAPDACPSCRHDRLRQDEDVLDTWFSSGLWPFSTMGWPAETKDLQTYYPSNVLVTGYDIIYFWVARMIFTALEFTGEKPFADVLIHGLIRDAQGRKMSKSLGNGVDPIEVIDQYGADALRFMLMTVSSPGNDLRFHFDKVEQSRNFANKIWNASRFVMMNLGDFTYDDIDLSGTLGTADRWILHRLNETAKEVNESLERYDFGEAGRILNEFIWNELCDWYIELAKLYLYGEDPTVKRVTQSVLVYTLDQSMRLLHPFMPFLTEEIWQHIPHRGESIMLADYPQFDESLQHPQAAKEMELLMDLIRAVRNIRAEMNVPPSRKIVMTVKPTNADYEAMLRRGEAYLVRFCNPETLTIDLEASPPPKSMTSVVTGAELYFPLAGLIDFEAEINRLQKELKTLDAEVERIEKKLANQGFVAKAPADIIEAERAKGEDYKEKREKVRSRLVELTTEGESTP